MASHCFMALILLYTQLLYRQDAACGSKRHNKNPPQFIFTRISLQKTASHFLQYAQKGQSGVAAWDFGDAILMA
jgi:hypothetical protein